MAGKERAAVGSVRKAVRDVLKLQEGDPLGEGPMLDAVKRLVAGSVDLTQLRDAIEWNHAEAFIRSEYIEEADLTGWIITKAGINHDRIK